MDHNAKMTDFVMVSGAYVRRSLYAGSSFELVNHPVHLNTDMSVERRGLEFWTESAISGEVSTQLRSDTEYSANWSHGRSTEAISRALLGRSLFKTK